MRTEAFYLIGGIALSLALILSGCGSSETTTTANTKMTYTVLHTKPDALEDGITNRYDNDDHITDEEEDDSKYYTTPSSDHTSSTPVTLPTSYTPDAGRLLGSQCAQCHGTNGISVNDWDSIAGEDDLHDEMFEDDEPIMMTQAKGYTPNEITLIENWLKTLKKYDD